MKKADEIMKRSVERLLFEMTDVKNYRISQETGIGQNSLGRYRRGESDIDNIPFGNMAKLYKYFLKIEGEKGMNKKMSRDEAFGRAFAVLDVISLRHFDRGKGVEAQFMQDFYNKPMTVYFRAHKRVMEYVENFDGVDLDLLDRINDYIGGMDADDYNDDQLSPKYLVFFSQESVALQGFIPKFLTKKEEERMKEK